MSKGFVIGLMFALAIMPSTMVLADAEESQADAKQGCCDKSKDCCDKKTGCEKDSQCTACTCKDCKNADCDVAKCACAGCEQADCKCSATACTKCDESGCHCDTLGVAGCRQGDCAEGKCCDQASCDVLTVCVGDGRCDGREESALSLIGLRTFAASPSATSDVMWHVVADEIGKSPCRRCESVAVEDESPQALAAIYAQPTPTSRQTAEGRRLNDAATDEGAAQIQYSIQIIEDRRGCMKEYEALRDGAPMMFAESRTLLPAIRMLAKNEVIRQLSSPKIMCTAGQAAHLEIGSERPAEGSTKWEGLRLEFETERFEEGLKFELAMHAARDERKIETRSAVLVDQGQTIVLKADAAPARQDDTQQVEPAVYIVVTPEIVK